jgi:hypothetical protein
MARRGTNRTNAFPFNEVVFRGHVGVPFALTATTENSTQHQKDKTMNVKRGTWSLVGMAVLSATAVLAQQVKTDYDRNADFSLYKTYSWRNVQTEDPLWVDRIKAAVNSRLAAKGWTQVESDGDVSIMAMEMTENHRTLTTWYDDSGDGLGWRWRRGFADGFGTSTTTESIYMVGTLVLDMFDTKTKMVVWRGSTSGTLSDKSDKNIKNLNKSVQKLFQRFPPDARRGQS